MYEPFNSDDYITELKLDGIRLLLTKFVNKVRLYTRHNNEVTALLPELMK
ncbi:ATP-dependent DNA ligase, partial [Mesobacillus zeae]